ncbi:hypothetical protein ACFPM3_21805 [Streptomyces coeruleoprunus]|uniref:Uncharacterized protein n=1 Tax=Streptomyces coeruleoprunus TaxID=285563 RepID=A0ABV9XJZ3_9ACTN
MLELVLAAVVLGESATEPAERAFRLVTEAAGALDVPLRTGACS